MGAAFLLIFAGRAGPVFAVLIGVWWLIASVADYLKKLVIEPSNLEMHGYVTGTIAIRKAETRLCDYVRFRPEGRSFELCFLEISDSGGNRLQVWRYGWGRQSRELFRQLLDWLEASPAEITPAARRVLTAAARR